MTQNEQAGLERMVQLFNAQQEQIQALAQQLAKVKNADDSYAGCYFSLMPKKFNDVDEAAVEEASRKIKGRQVPIVSCRGRLLNRPYKVDKPHPDKPGEFKYKKGEAPIANITVWREARKLVLATARPDQVYMVLDGLVGTWKDKHGDTQPNLSVNRLVALPNLITLDDVLAGRVTPGGQSAQPAEQSAVAKQVTLDSLLSPMPLEDLQISVDDDVDF